MIVIISKQIMTVLLQLYFVLWVIVIAHGKKNAIERSLVFCRNFISALYFVELSTSDLKSTEIYCT